MFEKERWWEQMGVLEIEDFSFLTQLKGHVRQEVCERECQEQ